MFKFNYNINLIILVISFFLTNCSKKESVIVSKSTQSDRIKIDGQIDSTWRNQQREEINASVIGDVMRNGRNDFRGSFKSLHDSLFLYLLIEIVDDNLKTYSDSIMNWWEQDNVELFFIHPNKKLCSNKFSLNDTIYHFCFSYGKERVIQKKFGGNSRDYGVDGNLSITHCYGEIENGYCLEIKIPIPNKTISKDRTIGFNVELSDNDNISTESGYIQGRETTLCWTEKGIRNSWRETKHYGNLVLQK